MNRRQLVLIVNKRTGTAHLFRDCDSITMVPDGALRVAHAQSSALPPLKYCRRCFEFSIHVPEEPAPTTAVLHGTEVESRREAPTPVGG